jgi:hypothetical protein
MEQVNWSSRKPVVISDGYTFYLDDALTRGAAYVDAKNKRVIVSADTWSTLTFDGAAMSQFIDDMIAGAGGMKFLTLDAGKYGDAARRQASLSEGPQGKDSITELAEEAGSLIVQAAGLTGDPTPMQRQIFFVRFAEVNEKLVALEARMAELRSMVDLAGTAVADL